MTEQDWKSIKWGDLATLEYGKGLKGYKDRREGYPVYGTNGQIGWHNEPLSNKNGIIIGRKGAYRGVHYSPVPFFVIDTAYYLKPISNDFIMSWAYFYLKNVDINRIDSGGAIPSLSRDAFYQIPVKLPPLSTQRKISTILSAYNNLIENNTRRIQILEEMAQQIYKEWFVDFKYPGYENDKLVDSELGMIPEGWEVDTLNSFGQISTGRTPSKKDPDNYGDYIPFIKIPDYDKSFFLTNYKEFLSETGSHLVNKILVPKNTLLITTIGTVGLVSITTTTSSYNQNINSLTPNNYSYLYYLLFAIKSQKKYLNALGGGGATFGTVSKSKLSNIKILNPKLEKIEFFKDLVKPLFQNMLILLNSNQTLRQTRDLLLPKLISGKIDVSDLDIDTSILDD